MTAWIAAAPGRGTARWRAARWLELGARLAFAVTIIALPLRARADLLPYPAWAVSAIFNDLLLFAVDVALVATLLAWAAARLFDPRPVTLGPRAIWVPAAAVLAVAWLTAPFGVQPLLSVLAATRLTLVVGLALYVLNEVEGLEAIALPLGLMLAIQVAVAVAQAVTQGPIGLGAVGETPIDAAMPGASVVTLPDGTRLFRVYGLSTHPNVLAGVLACGAALLLGIGLRRRAAAVLQVALVGAVALAVLLTFSRGGWLAISAAFGVGLILARAARDRPAAGRWAAAAGLSFVLAIGFGAVLRDAVATRIGLTPETPATEARSIDERLAQIGLAARVTAADPLTGAGIGGIAVAMRDAEPDFEYGYYPPHLVLVTATAELGVAGGLAVLALLGAPWVLLVRLRRRWSGELAAASAALAALEVASLFDFYPWTGGPGRTLTWLVIGLWVLAYMRAARRPSGATAATGAPA